MAKGLPYSTGRGVANALPIVRKFRYALNNKALAVTGGAATALGFGSANLGGLPEGNLLVLGALVNVRFFSADADVIATWSGNLSVGSTATADTTLDGTDANFVATTAIGAATAKLSPIIRATGITTAFYLDNTAASLSAFLNMTTADNSVTDSLVGDFTVNGWVDLVLAVLGDD
jgi:hypothetical protein